VKKTATIKKRFALLGCFEIHEYLMRGFAGHHKFNFQI